MNMSWFLEKPIAHRGWHWVDGIDENSWQAIELAMEKGYPIEFDVHLSRDGVPFIHHDHSLKRMTGRDVLGTSLTAKELIETPTSNSKEGIPLLKDVLERVNGKVPLVIEVKRTRDDTHLEEAVANVLENYRGDFSLQSFHPGAMTYFKNLRKEWVLGYLSGSLDDEDLDFFTRTLLKSLALTPFLKPDYIGYEIGELSKRAPQHMREAYNVPLIGWTVRNSHQEQICRKFADNLIFENIL
jgi:glycerophosphoryl diester phosphodiesterase